MSYALNPCNICGKQKAKIRRNPKTKKSEPAFYAECVCGHRMKLFPSLEDARAEWNKMNLQPR